MMTESQMEAIIDAICALTMDRWDDRRDRLVDALTSTFYGLDFVIPDEEW